MATSKCGGIPICVTIRTTFSQRTHSEGVLEVLVVYSELGCTYMFNPTLRIGGSMKKKTFLAVKECELMETSGT